MIYIKYIIIVILTCYAALYFSLQLPLVYRSGSISQPQPISQIADPNEALTFARALVDGDPHLLLVIELTKVGVTAVDLSSMTKMKLSEPFDAISYFGTGRLIGIAKTGGYRLDSFAQQELLATADGSRHVAFGTNFRDHGVEVDNETPFRFPRLNKPTPSITDLTIKPDTQMIDYEVELCMRFDRPVSTLQEFDDALKIIFLCGDFTDRKIMLDGIPENERTLSGIGFPDAKSLPGYFPTGPFMVVPRDWNKFVEEEVIGTAVNGVSMQYTTGAMMIKSFRAMTQIALEDSNNTRWTHRGEPVSLLPKAKIAKGQVLLSGTTAGVLFRPPSKRSKIILGMKYVLTGGFLTGISGYRSVVNDTIKASIQAKIMLMPGDQVVHHSSRLGTIITNMK